MQQGSGCHTNTHIQHYTLCACWLYLWLWTTIAGCTFGCEQCLAVDENTFAVEENCWGWSWKRVDLISKRNGWIGSWNSWKIKNPEKVFRGTVPCRSNSEYSLQVESCLCPENLQLDVAITWNGSHQHPEYLA